MLSRLFSDSDIICENDLCERRKCCTFVAMSGLLPDIVQQVADLLLCLGTRFRKHRRRRIYRTRACLQLSGKQHLRRIGLFPNQLVERFFPDQHALHPQQHAPTKITFSASHRGTLHQALRRNLDVQITVRRSKAALMLPSKATWFILSHRAYTTTSTLRFIPASQTHMGPLRILFLNRKLIKRFETNPLRIWRASSTPC